MSVFTWPPNFIMGNRKKVKADNSVDSPTVKEASNNTNENNEQSDTAQSVEKSIARHMSLEEKIDHLTKRVEELVVYAQEITSLKADNAKKDKKIQFLEQRIDALEQYTRRDDVVITGFHTAPVSLSRIVTESINEERNEHAPSNIQDSVEDQIVSFLNESGIPLNKSEISACHTIGRREKGKSQPIILRLVNRKTKTMMLKNGYKLKNITKPEKVYINEHLSKKNSDIARLARELRKKEKITSTWTRNCSVFVKAQHPDGNPRVKKINEIAELKDFE